MLSGSPVSALVAGLLLAATGCTAAPASSYVTFYSEEWGGVCADGEALSPINVITPEAVVAPKSYRSLYDFPIATGLSVYNTGHAMQLNFNGTTGGSTTVAARGDAIADLFLTEGPITRMKVTPLQMHWHTLSEHAVNGKFYAAEGHIVTLIAEGEATAWGCDKFWQTGNPSDIVFEKCAAVFGVFYKIGAETTPPMLKTLIETEPREATSSVDLPGTFDLNEMLPSRREYYSYRGSLTTPGCNQGLRWHVFKAPMLITADDLKAIMQNQATTHAPGKPEIQLHFKTNQQYIQPLNDRVLYYVSDPARD